MLEGTQGDKSLRSGRALVLGKVGVGIRDRWGGRKVWEFLSVVLFL